MTIRSAPAGANTDDVHPERIELTSGQKKYLNRLVSQMGRMEEALKAAQEALTNAQKNHDLAQNNAQEYLFICAEDYNITLGQGQWEFFQPQMAFVRTPAGNQASRQAAADMRQVGERQEG